MSLNMIEQLCGALADKIKERFPKSIVYRTIMYGDPCVEVTLDLPPSSWRFRRRLQYQIVFEDRLKICRYHKHGDTSQKPADRIYRDVLETYDISHPDADFGRFIDDLGELLDESLDDC